MPDALTQSRMVFSIDAHDIVMGLDGNDEEVLAFIVQLLEENDSLEVRERLAERLVKWDEDHREETSGEG